MRVLALHQLLSTHVIRIPYLQRHYAGSDINHDPLYAISLQLFFRTSTRKSSSVKRGRAPSLLPVSSGLELQMLWWHSRSSRRTYVQTRKKNKKMIVRSKTVQKGGALEPIRPLTPPPPFVSVCALFPHNHFFFFTLFSHSLTWFKSAAALPAPLGPLTSMALSIPDESRAPPTNLYSSRFSIRANKAEAR